MHAKILVHICDVSEHSWIWTRNGIASTRNHRLLTSVCPRCPGCPCRYLRHRHKRPLEIHHPRDLFLVTMIVAPAVGWWVDRRGLAREIRLLKIKPYYSMGPGRDFLSPKSYPAPVEFLP